jgi:hypothetical protein
MSLPFVTTCLFKREDTIEKYFSEWLEIDAAKQKDPRDLYLRQKMKATSPGNGDDACIGLRLPYSAAGSKNRVVDLYNRKS